MNDEIIFVLRIICYFGPSEKVNEAMEGCVRDIKALPNGAKVAGVTLGDVAKLFPKEGGEPSED